MPRENRGSRHASEALRALAWLSLTELVRSRMRWAVLLLVPALALFADFGATLALTDTAAIRLTLFGAGARLLLVAMIASTAFFTLAEDQRSGLAEFFITRGVARSSFFAGRALGVVCVAGCLALVAGVLAALLGATAPSALHWTFILWLELILVGWLAQTAAITLREPATGLLFVGAAYTLSRISPALLTIAEGLMPTTPSLSQQAALGFLTVIDRLLPNLADFAPGAVLLGEGASALPHGVACAVETMLAGLLILVVGLIDFQRLLTGRPTHGRLR